jgi:hypothetical protein
MIASAVRVGRGEERVVLRKATGRADRGLGRTFREG